VDADQVIRCTDARIRVDWDYSVHGWPTRLKMATLIRSCSSTPMLGQNFVWSALGQPGVDRGESVRASRFAVAAT
jgi:hypothetical protein